MSINSSTPGILGGGGGGGGGDVPGTRTITAGTGLTGGGDLSADRTLTVDFGTTSGKVAQGDDSRIVNAVQTSRTVAGLALSSDISVAALNTALGSSASLGVRTAIADTGWTDVTTGTASISRVAGVHTLSVNANASAREHRATISTAECPAIEVMGRFQLTTGNPAAGTGWATSLWLSNAAETYGFVCQVHETQKVGLYKGDGAMQLVALSTGNVSLTSLAWLRLVVTPTYAAAYYGTSGTSTPPTTWILASSVATTLATLADGYLTRVSVRTQRTNTGSGAYVTEWQDLQWRILGVAP